MCVLLMTLPMKRAFLTAIVLVAVCICSGTLSAASTTAVVDTAAFIDQACIHYETDFDLSVPVTVWERVIAHPLLIGTLWNVYGFEPRYELRDAGNEVYVEDGSGLEGYLAFVGGDTGIRMLLARGRLRNWGLPIGVKGRALFILRWREIDGAVRGDVSIYGEGTGSAADIVIRAFSPILTFFINRRIKANLRDFDTILTDIDTQPAIVRSMLADKDKPEFDRLVD